jgi:hypothetical protein
MMRVVQNCFLIKGCESYDQTNSSKDQNKQIRENDKYKEQYYKRNYVCCTRKPFRSLF